MIAGVPINRVSPLDMCKRVNVVHIGRSFKLFVSKVGSQTEFAIVSAFTWVGLMSVGGTSREDEYGKLPSYVINLGFMGETKPLTSGPKCLSFHNDIDCRSASKRCWSRQTSELAKQPANFLRGIESLDASF